MEIISILQCKKINIKSYELNNKADRVKNIIIIICQLILTLILKN